MWVSCYPPYLPHSSSSLLICQMPKASHWHLIWTSLLPFSIILLFVSPPNSHSLSWMIFKVLRASIILFHAFSCPSFYILRTSVTFQYFLQPKPYERIPPKQGSAEIMGSFQYLFSMMTTQSTLSYLNAIPLCPVLSWSRPSLYSTLCYFSPLFLFPLNPLDPIHGSIMANITLVPNYLLLVGLCKGRYFILFISLPIQT